ncbi:MAG: diaminopimelate epimerase [Verrucomicrobiales bacterium]
MPLQVLPLPATFAAMTFGFTKMNGAGNDFVLIDNRAQNFSLTPEQVVRICHRQRGIGADGLLLLIPSRTGNADWAWEFYNSDGSTADMCGNGARCFARFVQKVTSAGDRTSFETGAGIIKAEFQGDRVSINLTDPKDPKLNDTIALENGEAKIHSLNTGVPHAVLFVENADQAMVQPLGSEIRYHKHFAPKGTNVNFVQLIKENQIRVRTYERGVEGETLACGTGVTASALIAAQLHGFSSPVKVQVQGGDLLEVSFKTENGEFRDVHLAGPADFVFEGNFSL